MDEFKAAFKSLEGQLTAAIVAIVTALFSTGTAIPMTDGRIVLFKWACVTVMVLTLGRCAVKFGRALMAHVLGVDPDHVKIQPPKPAPAAAELPAELEADQLADAIAKRLVARRQTATKGTNELPTT